MPTDRERIDAQKRVWPEVISLGDAADVPDFPIDALPDVMGQFVSGAAEMTRTSVDLVAGFALGALGAVTAGRLYVEPWPGWIEPVNIWTAPIAAPGEGKSPAFNAAVAPIVALDERLHNHHKLEFAEQEALRRIEEQRLSSYERDAARAEPDKRPEKEGIVRDLAAALAKMGEPHIPELFTTDTTPEELERLLAANGGRYSWLSEEAGFFTMAAGRYSGNAQPQNFLTAWSGGPLKSRRISRKGTDARGVLTVSCAVQPIMLTKAVRHAELVGTGFLDRFLYLMPRSRVGYRPSGRTPDRSMEVFSWERLVTELFDSLGNDGRTLTMTESVETEFIRWRGRMELQRRPDGKLASILQWSAKLDGQLLRLIGLMAVARNPSCAIVDDEAFTSGRALTDYFVDHARAAFGVAGSGDAMTDARSVAAWLIARGEDHVSRREIHRAFQSRFPRVADLLPVVEILTEYGYVREADAERGGPGRPAVVYDVNPLVLQTEPTQ